jgi:hypothetical protein
MADWWSIEVFHGEFSARRWQDTYSNAFIESALSHGATDWEWHEHRWGVVLPPPRATAGRRRGRDLPARARR